MDNPKVTTTGRYVEVDWGEGGGGGAGGGRKGGGGGTGGRNSRNLLDDVRNDTMSDLE